MKAVFDTSVLVAAMLTGHPAYAACLPYLKQAQAGQITGIVATHTLAELYAGLNRIPQARISPNLAQTLVTDNLQTFQKVSLSEADYQAAIGLMVTNNLPGGGIYDALIAQVAQKTAADTLLTLNRKHFDRLSEGVVYKVQVPN